MSSKMDGAPAEIQDFDFREIGEELVSMAEMQRRIMPDQRPAEEFLPFEFHGETRPMNVVGGDFFDFIDLEGRFGLRDQLGLVIADAAGHGLAAAMLIRDFNTVLYTGISFQAHYDRRTDRSLLSMINRRMHRSSQANQFLTAFYAELRRDGQLDYVNAGHDSPVLVRAEGIERLEIGGPVLGALWNSPVPYEVGHTTLGPGELLVSFTDGIIEAVNADGEEYGRQRLEDLLLRHRELQPEALFNTIMAEVEEFSAGPGQTDDRTVVVIRNNNTGSDS